MTRRLGIVALAGLLALSAVASAGGLSYRTESLAKARELIKQHPEKHILLYYTSYRS